MHFPEYSDLLKKIKKKNRDVVMSHRIHVCAYESVTYSPNGVHIFLARLFFFFFSPRLKEIA